MYEKMKLDDYLTSSLPTSCAYHLGQSQASKSLKLTTHESDRLVNISHRVPLAILHKQGTAELLTNDAVQLKFALLDNIYKKGQ